MSLLQVVKDVCATVGVVMPTSVFSGITGDRTMQEMLSLANEMAQRIAYDTREWQRLKVVATFTGTAVDPTLPRSELVGVAEFNLPANFKRLLLSSNVWRSTSTQTPLVFFSDTDEWLVRRLRGEVHGLGEWAILGGQMHIYPPLRPFMPAVLQDLTAVPPVYAQAAAPPELANFAYLDKNCIALASGGYGDRFMADGDSFVLDERILKLGMIWQWKANKGSSYAEDMGTYADALMLAMGADSPAPIIYGRGQVFGSVAYAGDGPWRS